MPVIANHRSGSLGHAFTDHIRSSVWGRIVSNPEAILGPDLICLATKLSSPDSSGYRTSPFWPIHLYGNGVYQDSRNGLLPLKCHMHFLHFLDFGDDNRVRPAALKH